ncbi:hypothetical protein DFH09DRAFT_1102915 [Mycena vulgaris]|nr:hypothetical protein DFH09DRAFT_1102915 [Mycena vulgaris]
MPDAEHEFGSDAVKVEFAGRIMDEDPTYGFFPICSLCRSDNIDTPELMDIGGGKSWFPSYRRNNLIETWFDDSGKTRRGRGGDVIVNQNLTLWPLRQGSMKSRVAGKFEALFLLPLLVLLCLENGHTRYSGAV